MKDQIKTDKFLSDLQGEDELGAVVRAHLFIEHYVDQVIELMVPYPDGLKPLKLDFDGKLSLITALGVKPEVRKPLSVLGGMRNKFAHRPNYKLTKSEVSNLYKSLSKEDRTLVQKTYSTIPDKAPEAVELPKFKELDPKGQFTLLAIVVRTIIMQVRDELRDLNS